MSGSLTDALRPPRPPAAGGSADAAHRGARRAASARCSACRSPGASSPSRSSRSAGSATTRWSRRSPPRSSVTWSCAASGVHHTAYPQLAASTHGRPGGEGGAGGRCSSASSASLFVELTHGIKRLSGHARAGRPCDRSLGGSLIIVLIVRWSARATTSGLSLPLITGSLAGGVGVAAFAFAAEARVHVGDPRLGVPGWRGDAAVRDRRHAGRDARAPARRAGAAHGRPRVRRRVRRRREHPAGVHDHGRGAVRRRRVVPLLAVACVVAYVFSSHRGIYGTQRVDTPKGAHRPDDGPFPNSTRPTFVCDTQRAMVQREDTSGPVHRRAAVTPVGVGAAR